MRLRNILKLAFFILVPSQAFTSPFDENLNSIIVTDISNLNQLPKDTPSAFTQLDAKLISMLGLTEIDEILRLVPGMRVAKSTSRVPYIAYHGTNAVKSRTGLSIDGQNISQAYLHSSVWNRFDTNSVSKISVFRGAGGSTFGDEDFNGHVNVQTDRPLQGQPVEIEANVNLGSKGYKRNNFSVSGAAGESLAMRLNVAEYEYEGFDYNGDGERKYDGNDFSYIDSTILYEINDRHHIAVDFNYVEAAQEASIESTHAADPRNDPLDPIESEDRRARIKYDYNIKNDHILTINASTQHRRSSQIGDAYQPAFLMAPTLTALGEVNEKLAASTAFGFPYTGTITANEQALVDAYQAEIGSLGSAAYSNMALQYHVETIISRDEVDVGYEASLAPGLRMAFGSRAYQEEYRSDTYFDGSVESSGVMGYVQVEYRTDPFTYNLAFAAEDGDDFNETAKAVRLSLNWHATDNSTIRFSFADGYRTPDVVETRREWSYTFKTIGANVYNVDQVRWFQVDKNTNENVKPEEIESYNISFVYEKNGLYVDAKIFKENYDNLLSDNVFFGLGDIYNSTTNELHGLELDIRSSLGDDLDFGVVYSYMHSNPNNDIENMLAAEHQGAVYGIYNFNAHQSLALAYYAQSELAEEKYGRVDVVYRKMVPFQGVHLTGTFKFSHYLNDEFAVNAQDVDVNRSSYDTKNMFQAGLRVDF